MQDLTIWYRTRRLAKAHPFFGGKGRLLSLHAAKAMLRGRDVPDGSAVILRARAELGMPCREPAAPSPACASGRLRRGLACAFAVLLALCLFAATETGKALAEQIYSYAIRLFENRLVTGREGQSSTETEYNSQIADDFASELEEEHPQKQEMQTFASLEEFEKATGHVPFGIDDSDIVYEGSRYIVSRRNEKTLYSDYSCGDGMLVTTQMWNYTAEISVLTNGAYCVYTTDSGREVYCTTDEADGSIFAITALSDSILTVTAESTVPLDTVLSLFN